MGGGGKGGRLGGGVGGGVLLCEELIMFDDSPLRSYNAAHDNI